MALLMLKDLPRYECLLEMAKLCPELSPSAADVFLNLLRTGDMVFGAERDFFATHGITQGRFTVLMLLLSEGECPGAPETLAPTPGGLAEKAGVTRATMTGLIDTLVRDGFVTRQPADNDRRMTDLSLTPKGREFINRLLPEYFTLVRRLMTQLSEAERRTLVKLLGKVQGGATDASAPKGRN
jgi:DNA-binding MarR family transcriptional regulator